MGEIVLNSGSRKDDHPDGQRVEHPVVPLKRRRFSAAVPVWSKGDLNDTPAFSPACRCALGDRQRRAMQQDHDGMSISRPVETVPDRAVIRIRTASEGDTLALGESRRRFLPKAGVEKVAAIDERGRQGLLIGARARARYSGLPCQCAILVGGGLPEIFHRVPSFDQRDAFAARSCQFYRANFASGLLALQSSLKLLIVVELPIGITASTLEDIDEVPEEIVEIGFDAGMLQTFRKCIEHVRDGAGGKSRIGQWARIGLVVERTIPKELYLLNSPVGNA